MYCNSCGTLIQDNAPACPVCGAPNPAAVNQQSAPGQPYYQQTPPQGAPGQSYYQQTPPQGMPGQSYYQPTPPQGAPGQSYYQQTPPQGAPGQPYYQQTPPQGMPGQSYYQQPTWDIYTVPQTSGAVTVKTGSKHIVPIIITSAAAVLVITGLLLFLFVFRESSTDKLKKANSNAKLVFTSINSACADLLTEGYADQIIRGSYGPIKINTLYSGDPIQNAIKKALSDNGTTEGFVSYEIDSNYRVVYAQWSEKRADTMVGQYPNPETDPDAKHDSGIRF